MISSRPLRLEGFAAGIARDEVRVRQQLPLLRGLGRAGPHHRAHGVYAAAGRNDADDGHIEASRQLEEVLPGSISRAVVANTEEQLGVEAGELLPVQGARP